jgi:hypothetical protein
MSRPQSPAKVEEDSLQDEERTTSSAMTVTDPAQSPTSADTADLPTEKPAEQQYQSELTIQSSLQVLGGFMLLFNSYFDPLATRVLIVDGAI